MGSPDCLRPGTNRATIGHMAAGPRIALSGLLLACSCQVKGLRNLAAHDAGDVGGGLQGVFKRTGSMLAARRDHTATLLPNGKVLIAGGADQSGNLLASAELYDPAAGTFTATGSMSFSRTIHTATLLPSGLVLVAGGLYCNSVGRYFILAKAELYDPSAGTFTATGDMTGARQDHTATLLLSGKVLIAGGGAAGPSDPSAEVYDPAAGTFAATGNMTAAGGRRTATLLLSGKVLIGGGDDAGGASAELYDLAAGTFADTGSMTTARGGHTATLLLSGKVLVAGGSGDASAELYDPATSLFTVTGSLSAARGGHVATLLPSGMALIAGGDDQASGGATTLPSTELYDPATGTFTATGSMTTARSGATATLLPSGQVLITGGDASGTAELYE